MRRRAVLLGLAVLAGTAPWLPVPAGQASDESAAMVEICEELWPDNPEMQVICLQRMDGDRLAVLAWVARTGQTPRFTECRAEHGSHWSLIRLCLEKPWW